MILRRRDQGRLTEKEAFHPGLRTAGTPGAAGPGDVVWVDAPGQRLGAITVPSKRCKEVQRHLRGVQKLVSTDVVNHCEMEQNSRWDSKVVMATPPPPTSKDRDEARGQEVGVEGEAVGPLRLQSVRWACSPKDRAVLLTPPPVLLWVPTAGWPGGVCAGSRRRRREAEGPYDFD